MKQGSQLFSIVVPAYNYAHLILRALTSVQTQQDPHVEVIVVDDGSTDNIHEVVSTFKTTAPFPVHYVRQTNAGLAATRNHGIRIAKGDYLLFLDADDYLLPDALQRFRNFLQQHPDQDFICAGHVSFSDDKMVKKHLLVPALTSNRFANFKAYLLNKKISLTNGASLFHRRVFEKLRYPDVVRNCEDIVVFSQTLALFNCKSFPEPVLSVYKHRDSLRHQAASRAQLALNITDLLFDPNLLPPKFLKLKKRCYAQRYLSLFRSHYVNKNYKSALIHYRKAIQIYPLYLFKIAYFRKFCQIALFQRRVNTT